MRITLVATATAHGPAVDDLVALLADAGHEVEHRPTPEDWHPLLQDPGDLLVAAGGDGTVRTTVLAAAEAGCPFAILPFGTANNIAKTLGIVGDVRHAIASWELDAARAFDLGEVLGVGRFVEAVGGGLFAQLLRRGSEVEESPTVMGRETDRALAVLAELVREVPPAAWRVVVDGRDCSGEYLAVEVLNVRFAGPNVPIAPDADPGDGLLDVALVGDAHRAPMARYLEGRLALASGTMPPPTVVRGRSIELEPPAGVPLRLDDEPLEPGRPLTIRCLGGAASVVVEPRDRASVGAHR